MRAPWRCILLLLIIILVLALPIQGAQSQVHSRASPDDTAQWSSIEQHKQQRVPISTVAILTFLMAIATGLGALPFFFMELESRWAGICNGIASGVMLAASFDLIQEGQKYGGGSWSVFGILSGGLFILYSQKVLERFGDVKVMDVKGADARKMVLVVAIMTLHSFGEGSGVGVSFAGPKGLSQGITVALAIAVHNIPEGLAVSMVLASRGISARKAMLWSTFTSMPQPLVAVPAFICAEAFQKFLPFCMGFAAGCMIWMVVAEVIPDSFKDASPSDVASAATVSIALMEVLSAVLEGGSDIIPRWETGTNLVFSLLFGLGPLLGGLFLVALAASVRLPYSFVSSIGSGIALVLSLWRPLQLFLSRKMSNPLLVAIFTLGSFFCWAFRKLAGQHSHSSSKPKSQEVFLVGSRSKQQPGATAATLAMAFHGFTEGLALGVAAAKAGSGSAMLLVLPAALHGLPRGAAIASSSIASSSSSSISKNVLYCSSSYGDKRRRGAAAAAAAVAGLAAPLGAVCSILLGLDYRGLDCCILLACGALLPSFFGNLFSSEDHRSRKGLSSSSSSRSSSFLGLLTGMAFACVCLTSTRMVCLYTPYCRSAPEAVR